jgi:hypothetical protein
MSISILQMGDRVRVRRASKVYQIGDKGTVIEGPISHANSDEFSYIVAMDKDGPGATTTIFGADEIELGE